MPPWSTPLTDKILRCSVSFLCYWPRCFSLSVMAI
ncbi:Uncharacterised protein [Vibrio cholerae]|nr:Uncharacterised protein [Vibrio cholerae]